MRGHSFGTRAFIQGPPPSMTTTPSLRQAVYWSGLRQEIYNALSLQQAPDVDLSSLHSLFTALGPDDGDCLWANQAIAHCADVLLFSFGPEARSTAVHSDLQQQNQHWSDSRPPSFDPYFLANEEGEIGATFPDIRFSSPWHGKVPWEILMLLIECQFFKIKTDCSYNQPSAINITNWPEFCYL